MRFYQLIQDTVKLEELRPLLLKVFVHDPNEPESLFRNSSFMRNIHIFESLSDTQHENYFFQQPYYLCILLKGFAEFFFKDLLVGQVDTVGEIKILNLNDYMCNQPFRVVCNPKTEILLMGMAALNFGEVTEHQENTLQVTKFIQNELHRNIYLKFKSPIDSITLRLNECDKILSQEAAGVDPKNLVNQIKNIRNQLEILNTYVKKSVVKSSLENGTESLKLINSDPEQILLDFFRDIEWQATLTVKYTEENVKAFIDPFKIKAALGEIVSFFMQNRVAGYRHEWILNYIQAREQIEIIFYFSIDQNKEPEKFINDRDLKIISVQDNLPMLNEIILSHKGNVQIYEKDHTLKIRIIIPQNIWRIQLKALNIFVIDTDQETVTRLTQALNNEFVDANVMCFDNIDTAIASLYQFQPEAIFLNIDNTYNDVSGTLLFDEIYSFYTDSSTDECLFIPISERFTWDDIEAVSPRKSFNFLSKPISESSLQHLIRMLSQFISRYRILRHNYKDVKMSAERDGLTGLYNRWYMDEYCNKLIAVNKDSNGSFSMIITDIDNFKVYNDTNGHQLGDKALQKFARVLSSSVRLSDTVTRYGGEEFVILLPHTSKENAIKIAEKIRKNVENEPFENEIAQPLKLVTASFGVSNFPIDGHKIASILKVADANLYKAKQGGRNRVVG